MQPWAASLTGPSGYWMLGADGHVYGSAAVALPGVQRRRDRDGAPRAARRHAATGSSTRPERVAFGTAPYLGGPPGLTCARAVSTMSPTKSQRMATGSSRTVGVPFAFGDADFYGDMPAAT